MSGATVFVVSLLFSLYMWAILLRIILQIIRADYFNLLSQMVIRLTEAPCKLLDKIIPKNSTVDISAVVLLCVVTMVKVSLLAVFSGVSFGVLGLITASVCDIVLQLMNLYFYLIIIVAIASWIASQYHNPILSIIQKLTEPVLNPARKIIPVLGGIDFSPVVVLILIKLIEWIVLMPLLRISGVA